MITHLATDDVVYHVLSKMVGFYGLDVSGSRIRWGHDGCEVYYRGWQYVSGERIRTELKRRRGDESHILYYALTPERQYQKELESEV